MAAATLPTALLLRLERIVVEPQHPLWFRLYSWWKLAQAWSALRYSDHLGLTPANTTTTSEGVEFDLLLTKTAGGGKKVERRPSGIAKEAYLREADWISTGLELWREAAPFRRDYFLAPPLNLNDIATRELRYSEAAGWSRALWRLVLDEVTDRDIADAAASLFTEHSGRSYLTSAATAMGASDEYLLPVGDGEQHQHAAT